MKYFQFIFNKSNIFSIYLAFYVFYVLCLAFMSSADKLR